MESSKEDNNINEGHDKTTIKKIKGEVQDINRKIEKVLSDQCSSHAGFRKHATNYSQQYI